MLQGSATTAQGPAGSVRTRPRRLSFARGSHRTLTNPAVAVSDEKLLALIAAADGLRRQQQQRHADRSPSPAANERLQRLDWAVRAGQLVLANRAAQALTPTSGTAQS